MRNTYVQKQARQKVRAVRREARAGCHQAEEALRSLRRALRQSFVAEEAVAGGGES